VLDDAVQSESVGDLTCSDSIASESSAKQNQLRAAERFGAP
jgi:hypothetical protein